ncbi:MAG: biopolymer transporter ExbD [candidate division Zixibacteria bacterium]|nr:biopolymer transporter ExbD [candidate division Zixibacteria bacterium]MDD5426226.1 biopolymer transporter ExbD [candidate division Zixibacteria bacterium]
MAGADVAERSDKSKKKGVRRKKRRIAIRIDMTPMVDIAFLLLIFYMVSTVFSMPQAMEINLPPIEETDDVEVKESNLLTIRVDGESRYWWNLKTPTPENLPLLLPSSPDKPDTVAYVIDTDTLRSMLLEQNRANSKLNTLILIHRNARYSDMVNILDEIDIIERSWNEYTARQKGVKVDQLSKDDKFSYRYAIGDWEERDDKIMLSAIEQARAKGEL